MLRDFSVLVVLGMRVVDRCVQWVEHAVSSQVLLKRISCEGWRLQRWDQLSLLGLLVKVHRVLVQDR